MPATARDGRSQISSTFSKNVNCLVSLPATGSPSTCSGPYPAGWSFTQPATTFLTTRPDRHANLVTRGRAGSHPATVRENQDLSAERTVGSPATSAASLAQLPSWLEALEAFLRDGPEPLPEVDPEAVQAAIARQARLPALNAERTMPQLPVALPAREELAAAAGRSKVVGQFRALAEWLGPQGRALTPAKNIRPADARELVALLGTGDEGLKFRSRRRTARPEPCRQLGAAGPDHPPAGHPPAPGREGTPAARGRGGPVAARVRGRLRHRRRRLPSHLGGRAALPGAADIRPGRAGRPCHDLQHGGAGPGPPAGGVGLAGGRVQASTWTHVSSSRPGGPARARTTGTWSTSSTPSRRSAR